MYIVSSILIKQITGESAGVVWSHSLRDDVSHTASMVLRGWMCESAVHTVNWLVIHGRVRAAVVVFIYTYESVQGAIVFWESAHRERTDLHVELRNIFI